MRRISSSVTIGLLANPQTPLWITRTPKPAATRRAVGIVAGPAPPPRPPPTAAASAAAAATAAAATAAATAAAGVRPRGRRRVVRGRRR